jgi:hypothetical protein
METVESIALGGGGGDCCLLDMLDGFFEGLLLLVSCFFLDSL